MNKEMKEEFYSMNKETKEEFYRSIFQEYDTDKSGFISRDELHSAINQIMG